MEVTELLKIRDEARRMQDYKKADNIRDELKQKGILIEDTSTGTTWRYITNDSTKEVKNKLTKSKQSHRNKKTAKKRTRNVLKKKRFSSFATWLINTFGYDRLKGGVLDVAGGKGKMALEFAYHRNIPCTVIDPKIQPFSEFTSNMLLKSSMTAESVKSSYDINSSMFQYLHPNVAEKVSCPLKICQYFASIGLNMEQKFFDLDFQVKSHTIIIGLHADEATEAIVDVALKKQLPFAVVPCCVFPSIFPHRVLSNGSPVRSLDEFIQYLQLKDTFIQTATVPALGCCNTILYKL